MNGDSKGLLVIILFMLVPSIIGLLFYKLQKNRLKFKMVETTLKREELDKIIERVAAELQWRIYTRNKRVVEARTNPSFFSGSWGEHITILFDGRRVLANSICDLEKQNSVASMGRNKKNTQRLIDEIEKASQ